MEAPGMSVLLVIPACRGSDGILRKNLEVVDGQFQVLFDLAGNLYD